MRKYMVVAVDNAKARFLTLEPAELPEFMSGPDLVELEVLYNPEERASDDVVFSASRGGRRNTAQGAGHGYDDHRKRHRAEFERRFFQDVITCCERLSRRQGADRIVLVADSRTLGRIRDSLGSRLNGNGITVNELAENLAGLAPNQLHTRLANQRCLPARKPPQGQMH